MERTKNKNIVRFPGSFSALLIAFIVLLHAELRGQDISDYSRRVYDAYAEGRMEDWKLVLEEMEKQYGKTGSEELLYELLMAEYGYIGFCIKEDYKRAASAYLEKARDNLDILKEGDPGNAEFLALEGAFLGYEMGIHKIKAMVLGPRAKEKIDQAVEKDPCNLRALLEKANQLNFSPGIVGGDKEKAIEYYNKALRVIEADPARLKNNWIYVNTMIVLAQVYEKMGNNTYACRIYEKIMVYDPGIEWVKKDLYSACNDTDSSFD
ncbi:MAG: hypothetical protein K9J25_07090 [Bacteroidales bacterium]|nr:hypothetical protein [Bacteroidales bacterium]